MEIERKYLLKQLPSNLDSYASKKSPRAICAPRLLSESDCSNDSYYMTYKGAGLMVREEYNLPLTKKPTTILSKRLTVVSSKRHAISYLLTVV